MRLLLPLLFIFFPITLAAQSSPDWHRVYTFDESTVELNTALVTRIDKDISRVRFRWTFDQPEQLDGLKYDSQLEVMEFNCSRKQYRSYHLTFLDKAGNIVRVQDSPGKWRSLVSGSMMEKLFVPGCELIDGKTRPPAGPAESAELDKVALFTYDIVKHLEQTKDFKTLIDKFFVPDYITRYLHDDQTNWFLNLGRDTATKATPKELDQFYVASMNAGYLTSLYLISQFPSDPMPSPDKMLPPDIVKLLDSHPYTLRYHPQRVGYGYLPETIDDVDQMRTFTDLMDKISALMRTHVKTLKAEENPNWKALLTDSNFGQPRQRVCRNDCLGLPTGTKIFEVDIPIFHLQIAEIDGKLKVISAMGIGQNPTPAPKCENDVVITIERSACFGSCPIYSAEIHADGEVVYRGKEFVKEVGERRFKISQEKIQELIKEFQSVDYFSLKDKYDADENGNSWTDLPTTITSICLDGKKKKVVNYLGAPKKLDALEDKIDNLAGLYKYLGPL